MGMAKDQQTVAALESPLVTRSGRERKSKELTTDKTDQDSSTTVSKLVDLNPHPRDANVHLEEESHTYTIEGHSGDVTSVTTLQENFFPKFDADSVISKYYKFWQGPKSKKPQYKGKTREEIKKMWSDEAENARNAGTLLHKAIETWYNGERDETILSQWVDLASPEWEQFLSFHDDPDGGAGLIPFRTEMRIWSTDHGLAGTVDLLTRNEDGSLSMYDWKRSKHSIDKSNPWKTKGTGMLSDVPGTNYGKYCMQQNLYRCILEEFYGYKVSSMYLVRFHPSLSKYQLVKVPDWSDKAKKVLEFRKKQLQFQVEKQESATPAETSLESLLGNLSI